MDVFSFNKNLPIKNGGLTMKGRTIKEIGDLLTSSELAEEYLLELKKDKRKGVHKLIEKYEKDLEKNKQLRQNFEEMLVYERIQLSEGKRWIAGMDEAGRGPLAGPVVAAAVVLPEDFYLPGLNDSKQLKAKTREYFFDAIKNGAICYGIGIINNEEVDHLNIYQATKMGMMEAIHQLDPAPEHILIDAVKLNGLPCSSEAIVKGDQKSVSIAAASVLAKVTRDRIMGSIHKEYPAYNFAANMGYGTKSHMEAINTHGITPYHRRSFAPVKHVNDK